MTSLCYYVVLGFSVKICAGLFHKSMKNLLFFAIVFLLPSLALAEMSKIVTSDGFYACKNDRLLLEAERYVDDGDSEALNKVYASGDCFTTEPGTEIFIVQGSFLDCTEGERADCAYLVYHPIEVRVKGSRMAWWTYRFFLKRLNQ
jgi:hypothetical protein